MSAEDSLSTKLPIRELEPVATNNGTNGGSKEGIDIVATYNRVLASDPEVTMPVAAIEALISVLGHTTSSTVMETLETMRTEADRLKASVPNPLPLAAGTDLFQQYLLRSLKKQDGGGSSSSGGGGSGAAAVKGKKAAPSSPALGARPYHPPPPLATTDPFEETRHCLIANSRLFAARAKAARAAIAELGARKIGEGSVVLTGGGSRTVAAVLLHAAERHTALYGGPRFKVVYVADPRPQRARGDSAAAPADTETAATRPPPTTTTTTRPKTTASVVAALRSRGVPVAEVEERAVAHVLRTARVSMALLGAEVLCQNGGVFSRLGTFQLASLVRGFDQPVYIAAESHKIARVYPLSQSDLPRCGVQQELLFFRTAADEEKTEKEQEEEAAAAAAVDGEGKTLNPDPVDYTPPKLITSVITEYGAKIPSGIYEMLLDIYS